jgi:hypothetical protein
MDEYRRALVELERAEDEVKRHCFWIGGPYKLSSTIAEGQAAERRLERAKERFEAAKSLVLAH